MNGKRSERQDAAACVGAVFDQFVTFFSASRRRGGGAAARGRLLRGLGSKRVVPAGDSEPSESKKWRTLPGDG
jgi:hypothetical protein